MRLACGDTAPGCDRPTCHCMRPPGCAGDFSSDRADRVNERSVGDPDNTTHFSYRPRDKAEAVSVARNLIAEGHDFDLGLMQINRGNFAWLGLTVEAAFDPCRSIAAGAAVLTQISRYNTGSPTTGFRNGYVARVLAAAQKVKGAPEEQPQRAAPDPPRLGMSFPIPIRCQPTRKRPIHHRGSKPKGVPVMRSKRLPTQLNLFAAIDPRFMRGASSPGVHTTPAPLGSPSLECCATSPVPPPPSPGPEPVTSSPSL